MDDQWGEKSCVDQDLDDLLALISPETPSRRLRDSVLSLAGDPQAENETTRWWWPFGPLWRPVAVLACSALLGLGLGMTWSITGFSQDQRMWDESVFLLFGPTEGE
ncbi:MAG: hypothetical protein H7839_20210 [Magnetococcus sp. YQC-5]